MEEGSRFQLKNMLLYNLEIYFEFVVKEIKIILDFLVWRFEGTKDEYVLTHGTVELVFSDYKISRTTMLVNKSLLQKNITLM